MRFLADENVASSVVRALRKAGHDVFDVKENGWQGSSDQRLLLEARRTHRIIITHDKDFISAAQASVLLIRCRDQRPANVQEIITIFLKSKNARKLLAPCVLILSEHGAIVYRT